jgi:hypothetical protein
MNHGSIKNEQQKGAPGGAERPFNSTWFDIRSGIEYVQTQYPSGKLWEAKGTGGAVMRKVIEITNDTEVLENFTILEAVSGVMYRVLHGELLVSLPAKDGKPPAELAEGNISMIGGVASTELLTLSGVFIERDWETLIPGTRKGAAVPWQESVENRLLLDRESVKLTTPGRWRPSETDPNRLFIAVSYIEIKVPVVAS